MTSNNRKGREAARAVNRLDRRSLLIGAGLAAAGTLSYLRSPEALAKPISAAAFQAQIPSRVGVWTSRKSAELVLPALDEGDQLYENLETRIYEGPGVPSMMVLVAFSSTQQNNIQVHRPEVCYPASGFPVLWSKPTDIAYGKQMIGGRELLADRNGLRERILYWVRVGDEFPRTWAEQRISMAVANLKGSVPDGVLFRVSTLEEPDSDLSPAIRTFIQAFLEAIAQPFRDNTIL